MMMAMLDLIGSSTKFRGVFEDVGLVAPVDSAVLIRARPAPARRVIAQAIVLDKSSGQCWRKPLAQPAAGESCEEIFRAL